MPGGLSACAVPLTVGPVLRFYNDGRPVVRAGQPRRRVICHATAGAVRPLTQQSHRVVAGRGAASAALVAQRDLMPARHGARPGPPWSAAPSVMAPLGGHWHLAQRALHPRHILPLMTVLRRLELGADPGVFVLRTNR